MIITFINVKPTPSTPFSYNVMFIIIKKKNRYSGIYHATQHETHKKSVCGPSADNPRIMISLKASLP